MKRIVFAAAAAALLLWSAPAPAQFAEGRGGGVAAAAVPPGTAPPKTDGPLGALAVAPAPQQSGGVVSLGPITGNPAIDQAAQDLVNSLVLAGMGWIFWFIKNKLGVSIDKDQRDALTAAAQRQASSLVADGMVSLSGKTITVNDKALYQAVHALQTAVPAALKNFGITDPQKLADRIVDMIPQVPAMAPVIAAAHANGAAPLPPQPPPEKPS
jgi:hypothetical protein